MPVFADSVLPYIQAGWQCVIPVPPDKKAPPPDGFTGASGRDTAPEDLIRFVTDTPHYSVALRMPDDVIGIDVDHYDKGSVQKRGGDYLAELEAKLGTLPPTWVSSARPAPSGIRFYRVPAGLRFRTKLGDSIEIIQRHHRYAVVAPSPHEPTDPEAFGAPTGQYRWWHPSLEDVPDAMCDTPRPDMFGDLPAAWVEYLQEGATEAGPAAAGASEGWELLTGILADDREECAEVYAARLKAVDEMARSDAGCRHDVTTERVHRLVMLGAAGHPGVGPVLAGLREMWNAQTAGEGREDEYERMLHTSARKAVTVFGTTPAVFDVCVWGELVDPPGPEATIEEVREYARRVQEVVDRHSVAAKETVNALVSAQDFDTQVMLDHTIGNEVLKFMAPVLRYAVDGGTWMRRGEYRWEILGDLTRWAVYEVADRLPPGDPAAEPGTPQHQTFMLRKRLMTTAGRNAVAASISAATAAGTHPCSVRLTTLDADPEILWAGGQAWDLRAVAPADVDPGVPHLHAAAVAPADVPTPNWSRLVRLVWPEDDVREWALDVLSVSLTGYSSAVLPILYGKEGRGKSSVVTLIMRALGTYADPVSPKLLSGAEGHASIVYALKGLRLAFIDEGPRGGQVALETLKQLTGGTKLTGNRMRENPVTFDPTHTLVLTCNDPPPLADPAIRRRVRLIPCESELTDEITQVMRELSPDSPHGKWQGEAPGVLSEMMRRTARWLNDRSVVDRTPARIAEMVQDIAAEQDPVGQWVEDRTEPHPPGTGASELHRDFAQWCQAHGHKVVPSMTAWGTRLTRMGFEKINAKGGKRRPLRLRQGFAEGLPVSSWSPVGLQSEPQPETPVFAGGVGETESVSPVSPVVPLSTPISTDDHNKGNVGSILTTGELETLGPAPSSLTSAKAGSLVGKRVSRAKLTDEEKARRKAEASERRRAAAEEKRALALAEAAGPTIDLPALLDRASGRLDALTVEEAANVVAGAYARTGALTVDVETTGRPIGHREYALRTVQLGDAIQAVDFDATDPAHRYVIRQLLAEARKSHAFSAGADLNPLIADGLADEAIWDGMHDVVIPAKLADPTAAKGGTEGLKDLAPAVLGPLALSPDAEKAKNAMFAAGGWKTTKIDYTDPIEKIGWAQADPRATTSARYACSDVLDTGALALALPWPEPNLLARERTVEAMTARIGLHGWQLDEAKVRGLIEPMEAKKADALARARQEGVDNPGSPKQLATRLQQLGAVLPLTDKGNPSTDKKVIAKLEVTEGPWRPLVNALKDYREAQNRLGLFLGPWLDMCVNGDGRMRPTVYTLEARTGRMSCVRPNLQQVPKYGGYRSAVVADPGHVFISADFSGVEIRVAAALSQDPKLLAYIAEEDQAPEGAKVGLHWAIARQVWGPEATGKHRKTAKIGVFSTFYGSGPDNLAGQLGITVETAKAVQTTLFELIPGYKAYSDQLMHQAQAGQIALPSYSGRTLWLPKDRAYASGNTAVQGTARELLVDGMVEWRQTRWGGCTLLPVHDELIIMVREEEAEEATTELVRCMERDLFGVRIKVEASAPSPFWLDGD